MPTSPATGVEEKPNPTAAAELGARCQWCAEPLDDSSTRLADRVVCARCGAASTDPPPSDEELDRAYSGWYRPDSGRFVGPLDAPLRHSRGRLAAHLDEIAPPGEVLDVGTGDGALLDALSACGRDAVGIERTESPRADVRAADLSELEGPYAAIVFWHSLEHLREAGAALARAASLLAPGGVLVVAMPNTASLQARAFGDRWLALDMPRHLVHVPAPALIESLGSAGLEVQRVSSWRGGQGVFGWLHGLVGSLPGHPDLYHAIRRPEARREPMHWGRRMIAFAAAVVLFPVAAVATVVEASLGRGGSIYVEARRV